LAGSYEQVYNALNDALGSISDNERDLIFGDVAAKFYGLQL
jgi:predicted TIM-barrel fold metal-dependent hydrolase